ncbi:MAG: TolC family protein [Candidatus Omnitrophica bacterium]|nr:TolC family protein [Candidatus Omnitrophota bacterium]
MNKLFLIILCAAYLLVPAAPDVCASFEYALSLGDAVELAFKNNKDIRIREQEIGVARANILGSQSAFLPKLDVGANYTYNDSVLTLTSLAPAGRKDPQMFIGYKSDNKVNAQVTETFYNGGANITGLKQARLGLKIASESLRAEKLSVEFETKRLYYGLLLARENVRIARDLVGQAEAHYADVKNKYNQGTSSRFDLLQSKVQVAKVFPELIKARNQASLIEADLKKLLGIDQETPLAATDKLGYTPVVIRESEFLTRAYAERPEIILKTLGVDVSKLSIRLAEADYLPSIDGNFGYTYRSDDMGNMINPRHETWNIGVAARMTVFDGFSTTAKVNEAKARYGRSVLEKGNIVDQTAVDIRRGCLDLEKALAVIHSQRSSIVEAKEALKIAEISYDNGEGTNLDILDAQISLSQLERNLAEAIYDYCMAKAFLDRTIGGSQWINRN